MAATMKVPGLGKPVKSVYVYIAVGTVAGILLFAYWRRNAAGGDEEGTAAAVADPAATDPYAQFSDAAGYNTVFPSAYSGSGFSQYGYDMYGQPLPPPTGVPGAGGAYQTNLAWSEAAIDHLERTGVTENVAAQAVSSVLGGLLVTSDQQAMFLRALGTLGPPPQDYPQPIRLKDSPAQPKPPPVVTPPKPKPGKQLPKPGGLRATVRTASTLKVAWNPVKDARGYNVWLHGDPPGGKTPQGVFQGRVTSTGTTLQRLVRNHRYRVEVRAVGADGGQGAEAQNYFWTRK